MGEEQPAAPPLPGARLLDLVAVMDTLRRDCPWDARQTHESLLPYLIEETYEAADAVAAGDLAALCGELGDVLLQVVFHARVAAERTDGTGFDIDDVADGIIAKLTRRHPHRYSLGAGGVGPGSRSSQNWDADQGRRAGGGRAGRAGFGARRRAAKPARALAGGSTAAPGGPGRGVAADLAELPATVAAFSADPAAAGPDPAEPLARTRSGPLARARRALSEAWPGRGLVSSDRRKFCSGSVAG